MRTLGKRFLADERGATAIEYGLILAVIFLAIITSITFFADTSNGILNRAMNSLSEAMSGGPAAPPPAEG